MLPVPALHGRGAGRASLPLTQLTLLPCCLSIAVTSLATVSYTERVLPCAHVVKGHLSFFPQHQHHVSSLGQVRPLLSSLRAPRGFHP